MPQNSEPKEPIGADIKAMEKAKPTPAEPSHPAPKGKVTVQDYLLCRKIPVWEMDGRIAYAIAKKKRFATDAEFDELFKSY